MTTGHARQPLTDEELQQVAKIYNEAKQNKQSAQNAIAKAFGITTSGAANRIAKARKRGFLADIPAEEKERRQEVHQHMRDMKILRESMDNNLAGSGIYLTRMGGSAKKSIKYEYKIRYINGEPYAVLVPYYG